MTEAEFERAYARGVILACNEGYRHFKALAAAPACSVCGTLKDEGDRPAGWAVSWHEGAYFVTCIDCEG